MICRLESQRFMRAPSTRSLERGFTMIELMVVMLLIGILSAIILPEMKGTFGDALLRSSGRELVNVFTLAYSRAVSLNQIHVVRLNEAQHKYSVERRIRGQGKRAEFAPLKDVTGSSGQLDERILVEMRKPDQASPDNPQPDSQPGPENEPTQTQPGSITFYPDGTADAAEVLLRDQAGYGLRLRIDPTTARVEVFELPRK